MAEAEPGGPGAGRRRPAAGLAASRRRCSASCSSGPPAGAWRLAGVTKHSSLARGGAPLLGHLEREGERRFGPAGHVVGHGGHAPGPTVAPTCRSWPPGSTPTPASPSGSTCRAGADPEAALGALSALSDDAAFPGYPYPLSVADRLAACPGWVRDDVRSQLEEGFDRAGVPLDVRERAFTDRHRLMERA